VAARFLSDEIVGVAYSFYKLTHVFTNYLRRPPLPSLVTALTSGRPSKRFLHNARWRGIRMVPYMDDFRFLADSYDATVLLRQLVDSLVARLGLLRNPQKGLWTPTQVGYHLGLTIDFNRGEFCAPQDKLHVIAQETSS
jgi:hypothetical protein